MGNAKQGGQQWQQQQQQQRGWADGSLGFCAEPSFAQPQLQSKQMGNSGGNSSSSSYTFGAANSSSAQNHAAVAALVASLQQYSAAAAAAAAAASGLPGAMAGLVLSPAGFWQQLQQQQQQQSRADGWYERLVNQKKSNRQPWDAPAAAGSGIKQQDGITGSNDAAAQQQAPQMPCGIWGQRGKVHDAWLYIDGRTAAALPWQALAAAAAAGGAAAVGSDPADVQAAALAAAASFMEGPGGGAGSSSMSQMSVQGKKLLLKVIRMKSAAGVLRRLGKDPKRLEGRVLQLLKQQTGPAGAQLLLWSVDDQQQQQVLLQDQQQQLLEQLQLKQLQLVQQQQQQQQQRRSTFELGVGTLGAQLGALVQQSPSLVGQGLGMNPRASGVAYLGLAAGGDMLGQHLPLLPAARSKALVTKAVPGTQQQQQQQQLQQQQQQLMSLLAQQQRLAGQQQQQQGGQLQWQPSGTDQQQAAVGAGPVDMQQLLVVQQHLLRQTILQQQQQQQQQLNCEASGTVPGAWGELPLCRKMVLARRTRATLEEPLGAEPAAAAAAGGGGASVTLGQTAAAAAATTGGRYAVPLAAARAASFNIVLTCPAEPSRPGQAGAGTPASAGLGSIAAGGGLQAHGLRRRTQPQQQRQVLPLQPQQPQQQQLAAGTQQRVQHTMLLRPPGKADYGSTFQQLPAQQPASAVAPTSSQQQQQQQQQHSQLAPPARSTSPASGPVFVSFVASNSRHQQQGKQKAQQRRRTDGGLLPIAASSAAVAGVKMTPLQRANLASKIGGSPSDASWRQQQQQQQGAGSGGLEPMPAFLRAFLNQQQQQHVAQRQQTKSAGFAPEQQQQQQQQLRPAPQAETSSAVHTAKAPSRCLQHKRHASTSGVAAASFDTATAAPGGLAAAGGRSSRPAAVSVSQPQLPQLAALRVAAEAGAKSGVVNAAGGTGGAGAAAGLLPVILSKSM
jgi:hypothetical protein